MLSIAMETLQLFKQYKKIIEIIENLCFWTPRTLPSQKGSYSEMRPKTATVGQKRGYNLNGTRPAPGTGKTPRVPSL